MDYQNGNYGYPPYDEDPNAGGQDPNAPQPYRDDPAGYGATPINYGQNPNYDAGNDGYSARSGSNELDYSSRSPRTNYGGMDASLISQMKAIEDENRRLKRMYADLSMQADLLREALGKK